MPEQPPSERKTQNRVITPFTDQARPDCLGYRNSGEWNMRETTRTFNPVRLLELNAGKTSC